MSQKSEDAWSFLSKFHSSNHLSKNFNQSVTNWIFWYFEDEPEIIFEYKNNQLKSVSLLDPKRIRIRIEI